jgi:hypothetical protein
MGTNQIVVEIDAEIARLQEVRALLVGGGLVGNERLGRRAAGARKKRTMSAEARERIASAQRKRWAKQKKAAKKS